MEPIIDPNAAPAAAPAGLIKDATAQSFVQDVIEASQDVPVIVDFWAPRPVHAARFWRRP